MHNSFIPLHEFLFGLLADFLKLIISLKQKWFYSELKFQLSNTKLIFFYYMS